MTESDPTVPAKPDRPTEHATELVPAPSQDVQPRRPSPGDGTVDVDAAQALAATTSGEAKPADTRTPDQIRADIAATRRELEQTVDALSAKLDVKARASAGVAGAKAYATDPANRAQVIAAGVAVVAVVALLVTRKVRG